MPDHTDAIDLLSRTTAVLDALSGGMTEANTEQPRDGAWGLKHVVAHLTITDHLGSIGRIRRIVSVDSPLLPEVDEDEALRESGLLALPTAELLEAFTRARDDNVTWLRSLQALAFERTGKHSAVGLLTGSELLFHAAYHDTAHLQQITAMLGSLYEPLRGGMWAF